MAFADLFRQLVPDMTPSEVEGLLGPLAEIDDTTIPAGSDWGLQDSLRYKIRAGEALPLLLVLDTRATCFFGRNRSELLFSWRLVRPIWKNLPIVQCYMGSMSSI